MNFADLDLQRSYTYEDYYSWPFEERTELIKGRVFAKGPSPGPVHNQVRGYIGYELGTFLKGKKAEVYYAPFDVRFPDNSKEDKDIITVLQPDICVVCDISKLDYRGCIGAPDIVVEILSPGNNSKVLKNKYEVYEESGVKEYWVVSLQDETFIVYTLTNGRYYASRLMVAGDIITSSVLDGFSLDFTQLFRRVH